MTEKLYDKDAYLAAFEATVLSCEPVADGYAVLLDRTAFFPEEGGQACDSGTLNDARVLRVELFGDNVLHITDRALAGTVTGRVDFAPRYDKMQQHTGEHIVCGIVHQKYGYDNVGFHLGAEEVTFDLGGKLTQADIDEIERLANRAVQQNAAVTAFYPDEQTLAALDYRSKKEIEGPVRIVEIDGIDRCACCAPHVRRTGEVGVIKLLDRLAYKGGTRIFMACGMRAVADYQQKQKNLETIARALSCVPNNAASYFERYAAETENIKKTLGEVRRELIAHQAAAIPATEGNLILFKEGLDNTALRLTVNALAGKYKGICAVFSNGNFTAASDSVDLTEVAARMRSQLHAQCGGSAQMIRGAAKATREEIEAFFNTI